MASATSQILQQVIAMSGHSCCIATTLLIMQPQFLQSTILQLRYTCITDSQLCWSASVNENVSARQVGNSHSTVAATHKVQLPNAAQYSYYTLWLGLYWIENSLLSNLYTESYMYVCHASSKHYGWLVILLELFKMYWLSLQLIHLIPWSAFVDPSDVNQSADNFLDFNTVIRDSIPMVTKCRSRCSPWITPGLKKLINKKHTLQLSSSIWTLT